MARKPARLKAKGNAALYGTDAVVPQKDDKPKRQSP